MIENSVGPIHHIGIMIEIVHQRTYGGINETRRMGNTVTVLDPEISKESKIKSMEMLIDWAKRNIDRLLKDECICRYICETDGEKLI